MTDDEVDAKIDAWHASGDANVPLYEFLGWTEEQYTDWLLGGDPP